MPALLALAAIILGWALITNRLKWQKLPPALLALAALIAATRGEIAAGIVGAGIAAAWYQGSRMRRASAKPLAQVPSDIEHARTVLGALPSDDADTIRLRHRERIAICHPDKGGNNRRAAELNKARDLLLTSLSNKSA